MKRYVGSALLLGLAFLAACSGDPAVQRDKFFESGKVYAAEGKDKEAAIQFRNALQLDSQFVPVHIELAKTLQRLGDHEGAYSHFSRAVSMDDSQVDSKLEMGRYHLLGGSRDPEHYKNARKLAQEILDKDPDNVDARILLGNASAGLNETDESIREMQEILEKNPANLTASINLAIFQMKAKDLEVAEQIFKDTIKSHPSSVEAHRAIGNFYLVTRRFGESESHYKTAIELDPKDLVSIYSLVRFYIATDQPDKVEPVFKSAVAGAPDEIEARYGLANYYIASQKVEQGMELLEELASKNRTNHQVNVRLAEVYMGVGRLPDAELVVQRLRKNEGDHPEVVYLEGRVLLAKGHDEEALEKFDRATELDPRLVPAFLQKASLHLKKQELELAKSAIDTVLRVNRNHPDAISAMAKIMVLDGRPKDAIQLAESVLKRFPNGIDALSARGEAYLYEKRLDESEADYRRLVELQPSNPFFRHRLGSIAAERGQDDLAIKHFHDSLKLDPEQYDVMNDEVAVYIKAKRFDQAFKILEDYENRVEAKDMVFGLRSRVYVEQGNFAKAEVETQKAIDFRPDNFEVHLAMARLKAMQGDLDAAIAKTDELLAKDNRSPIGHFLKAYFLEELGRQDEAVPHYKKAIELDPENHIAANALAWIYCRREQNMQEALELATNARRRQPDSPQYADTLGWVHYKLGNYTSAVHQLRWAVDNNEAPDAENYYRLGMAYYRAGDTLHAGQTLRKAVQTNPSFPNAQEAQSILKELG